MINVKTLYYYRTEVSVGIDVNKSSESKECDIVTIGIFKIKGLNFNQMSATHGMIC